MALFPNEYIVRVNACPLWKEHKAVTLGMCMGNPNWEGAKFVATLEWGARHFDFIRIALSDTLGRHNYIMQGMDPETASQKAFEQGEEWLAQHKRYLPFCGKPYEIVRWDHWLNHADFAEVHAKFGWLAQNNRVLAQALDTEITLHLERLRSRGLEVSGDGYKNCLSYLLEELAGTTLRARSLEKSCRIYPAPEPAWLEMVRNKLIPDAPMGLEDEYYVAINLRRRKLPDFVGFADQTAFSRAVA